MPGFIDNGLPNSPFFTDAFVFNADTNLPSGENPASVAIPMRQLATALLKMQNQVDKTTVAGTVYYLQFSISGNTPIQLTGVEFLIGTTGGTDKVMACVFDANGNAFAQSDSSGVTIGTASTWQQLPFKPGGSGTATPVLFPPGKYFIGLQSNGTTAKFAVMNAPGLTVPVGSKAGSFGTIGTIIPPTTYTQATGPMAEFYQ